MKHKNRLFLKVWIACSLVFFVVSCNKDSTSTPTPQTPTYLVSSTLVKSYTKTDLISQLNTSLGSQASTLAIFMRSGIQQYQIVYKTQNTDGTTINASGALIIPSDLPTESLSMVSMQHATIKSDADAPSNFSMAGEAAIGSFFSSVGYFIVMPDYIGYGASNAYPHPYEYRSSLASSSLDMIRAAKEFISTNKLNWNTNLLIAGYSEGGYATMSLQKKIETEFPTEFNLKASSCGAGAYNKTLSFQTMLSQATSGIPSNNSLYLWVLLTYDSLGKLNRPMTDYFVAPYAAQIASAKQNAQISVSLNTIVTDTFKNGVVNGTDTAYMNVLKDNDVYNWKPKTPTRLYHGDADELVPYFNSQTAYDAMTALGAPDVQLVPIKNGTHESSIQQYLLNTFSFFSGIK